MEPTAFAATILGAVIATLIGQRLLDHLRNRDRVTPLIIEVTSLKTANTDFQETILQLQVQLREQQTNYESRIADIANRLAIHEDGKAIRSKYVFAEKTGTYINKENNLHSCPFCIHQTPIIESPMRDDGNGWRCLVCNNDYPDSHRPVNIDWKALSQKVDKSN